MNKIIWKTEKRKVKDLIPADWNPRYISEKERDDLMESIKEFSEVEPVVVNTNNHIIGGHQRINIYADLAIEEIDVRIPDRELTSEEEMRLNLRLNKNIGSWDTEKLKDFNIDMLLDIGFGDEELSSIWNNIETTEDQFKLEEAIEKAKITEIKRGDIYQLGDHRLMCGDATKEEDVGKLMDGKLADMIFNDPPYNIKLNYSTGIGTKDKYQGEYQDNKTDKNYKVFIYESLKNALKNALKDAHFFYWCDEKYIWMIQQLYEELGIENKRICFWIKNNQNPTPQIAFNKVCESCIYGITGKPFLNPNYKAFNEIMNREVGTGNQLIDDILDLINLWIVKRDVAQDYEHPTQKPITLCEKPIKRCTGPKAIVIDLFGGSGSTLMACEQLKRKCYMCEIDPIFCQVIINRWEEYVGNKAQKIN